MTTIIWRQFRDDVGELADMLPQFRQVYGIPTGGCFVACHMVSSLPMTMVDAPTSPKTCLIVDDIIDSGSTLKPFIDTGYTCAVVYGKQHSPRDPHIITKDVGFCGWIKLPWEHEDSSADSDLERAIMRFLQSLGEDSTRDGLRETPKRVVKAWKEMTCGYGEPPEALLKTFSVKHDEMVVVKNIRFESLCEHHVLPFFGTAHVGYVPKDKVVGLSKIPRLVLALAKRLQVQERLTDEIAHTLHQHLDCLGVGVVLTAHHTCMSCRGVKQTTADMVTSALLGVMRQPEVRSEFLTLCGIG